MAGCPVPWGPGPAPAATANSKRFDSVESMMTFDAFRRRWWLFVLLPTIGLVIAALRSRMSHAEYQSMVTLQLNPAAKSPFLPFSPQAAESEALVASYREVLRSRAFA